MGLNVQVLRDSFQAVAPAADELTKVFYATLFERYPGVKPLFSNGDDMTEQGKKLTQSLVLIVANLEDGDKLTKYLNELGSNHVGYGAEDAHYDAVGECLLHALSVIAGDLWTDEVKGAWTDAYGAIAGIMIEGAKGQRAEAA